MNKEVAIFLSVFIPFVLFSCLALITLQSIWNSLEKQWPRLIPRRRLVRDWLFTFLAIVIGFFLFIVFTRYVGSFGLASIPAFVEPQASILTQPHFSFSSRVLYHVVHPQRGSIVIVRSEKDASMESTWRSDVEPRFHFVESENHQRYLRRVVGVPGEKLEILGGEILVNGVRLEEAYVDEYVTSDDRFSFNLHDGEFLLARDTRTFEVLAAPQTFVLVNIDQIEAREFFVLWPPEFFGFVKTPHYNIPDPPVFKIRLSDPMLYILTNM